MGRIVYETKINEVIDAEVSQTHFINDMSEKQIDADGFLEIDYAHITNGTIDNAKIDYADVNNLNAHYAEIENGKIKNATIDSAKVNDLDANYAHITNGTIDNAKIDQAKVENLSANYAQIKNGYIDSGLIKDASISDAQILGVSANKLTAGTIDASKVNVTNLNADNLTVGTINGKRIGNESITLDKLAEEVPTKEYLNNIEKNLQGQIDGAIETWTSTVVPTLNNHPASSWTDAATRKKHVGDVCYVLNTASEADGFCYRFAEGSNGAYEWVLIKDSDVTKTLQDLIDVQGDVSGLKTFKTDISSWKNNTDEELSSIKSRTSTLETGMGNKVETTVFNEVKQTVGENSRTITSLTEKVDSKADGDAVTTLSNTVNSVKQTADSNTSKISNLTTTIDSKADSDTVTTLSNTISEMSQDLSGFKSNVSKTYATQKTVTDNLATAKTYAEEKASDAQSAAISAAATDATSKANAAQSAAVTSANSNTAEKLKNYSTTEQMNSAISTSASSINLEVAKKTDKTAIISTINQSAESVTINASKINLNGALTISKFTADDQKKINDASKTATDLMHTSDTTKIDGGKIYTGSVTADQIASNAVTANKIAATSIELGKLTSTAQNTITNAAKTASNYIKADSNGIMVTDNTKSTLGNNVLIDSDSVDIRSGTNVLASFGENTMIGGALYYDDWTADNYENRLYIGRNLRNVAKANKPSAPTLGLDRGIISQGYFAGGEAYAAIEGTAISVGAVDSDGSLRANTTISPRGIETSYIYAEVLSLKGSTDLSDSLLNIGTYKTASPSSAVSLVSGTAKAVTSISLEAGVWILDCRCQFASNKTGYRRANISTSSGSAGNGIVQYPSQSSSTYLRFTEIVRPTATTTYYLNQYQNSGSTLTASTDSYIHAVRIK